MNESFSAFVRVLTAVLWGPHVLLLILLAGVWFTLRGRFMHVTKLPGMTRGALCGTQRCGGFSAFQSLTASLAGSLGTGNILGVAAAILVGGAGENAAAAVGTGVVEDGKAFTTIGTSGVVFAHTDNISIDPKGRVHTFCCAVPGAWHVMGVTQGAGLSLKWFRDNFCGAEKETAAGMGVDPYYLMDQQAARSPIGCNRLLYLPYLMGERTPHLDPDCRGAFIGLSAMHTKYDMLRAVMEGVTYSQRDSVEVLKTMGVSIDGMLACGGGGSSKLWRQMLADTYNCAVRTVVSKEGPALGVAILAGVGAGLYPSVQEGCRRVIRLNAPQEPIEENVPKYEAFYRMYTKLYPALKDCYKELAAL